MKRTINFLKVREQDGKLYGEYIGKADTLDQEKALPMMQQLCSTIYFTSENTSDERPTLLNNEVFGLAPRGMCIPSGETSTWIGKDNKDGGVVFMIIDTEQELEVVFADIATEAVPILIERES